MKKFINFYCEVYGTKFYFLPGHSQKEVNKFLSKKSLSPVELEGYGLSWIDKDNVFIWLKESSKDDNNIGRLVHETHHAVSFLSISRGITADFENDEPSAYLQQFIFDNCIKGLR